MSDIIKIESTLDFALHALKRGDVGIWNAWRKKYTHVKPCLDDINLENIDLSGVDFSKVSLQRATISHCRFYDAKFISANLSDADLRDCDFTKASLIAANFTLANLSQSCFLYANFLTASVRGATLRDIDFRSHDLSSMNLRNTDLSGSNLSKQNLSNHDLKGIVLVGADLSDTDLRGANLTSSNLTGAIIRGAKLDKAIFTDAVLCDVDFTKQNLQHVNFKSADLRNSNFKEAQLSYANLSQANISGSHLWRIKYKNWILSNVECTHAYWDKTGKEKTEYTSHEFERIYASSISIRLNYPFRLTSSEIATLPIFIDHLQASHWGIVLRLKSIEDVAGGAEVTLIVEEMGPFAPALLLEELQQEATRIQLAQISARTNMNVQRELKENIGQIKEKFWPRLLEIAAEHEHDQVRNLTILFMDLKGFSNWTDSERSNRLSLFRGLLKPVLKKWKASYPNMEGDSLRITFRNASIGLACACMIRNVLTAAGFELRIGIDLGEVMVVHNEVTDQADLEGAAVTMAARLEAIAEPGEILITDKVRHYSDNKGIFEFVTKRVKLAKSVGVKKQGDAIECHAVNMKKSFDALD